MKPLPLLLAGLALWCLPATAETLHVRGELDGEHLRGRAQLDLDQSPARLKLSVGDVTSHLVGYPLEHGDYLFVEPPTGAGLEGELAEVLPRQTRRAVVVASLLNVRPTPGLASTPLRQVRRGEVLELSGVESGPWLQLADGSSWVHGSSAYVRVEQVYDADSIPSAGPRLTLRPRAEVGGYLANLEGTTGVLRFVPIAPAGPPRVLLIPTVRYTAKEQRTLKGYALKLKRYYTNRGIPADLHQASSAPGVIRFLEDAALAGKRYKRIVWIGHGGWDGPIMGTSSPTQVSAKDHPQEFEQFVVALDEVLTPDARLFASACHAAGNNKYEAEMPYKSHYNWVHDVAKRTGRLVAGPAGYTSTEYTYQHVLAILEGQGTVKQEVHVATRETLRIVWPGRTLAGSSIRPLPPIRTTSNPGPTAVSAIATPLGLH